MLALILGFSLTGFVGALVGSGLLLAFPGLHARLRTPLLAYAIGALLGASFLGLLPEALAAGRAHDVLAATLAGFMVFFLFEKLLRMPHMHVHAGRHPVHPAGRLILWGDAFHNFIDGIVIALAFMVSVPLGVMAALAVLAHEIPQELGDFVILVHSGWERWQAYRANALSALATLPGALLAYSAGELIAPHLPLILALAAGAFLYVAATDLAPVLHHEAGLKQSVVQATFIVVGIATTWGLHRVTESMFHGVS